jgi:hypothetical protein
VESLLSLLLEEALLPLPLEELWLLLLLAEARLPLPLEEA